MSCVEESHSSWARVRDGPFQPGWRCDAAGQQRVRSPARLRSRDSVPVFLLGEARAHGEEQKEISQAEKCRGHTGGSRWPWRVSEPSVLLHVRRGGGGSAQARAFRAVTVGGFVGLVISVPLDKWAAFPALFWKGF